MQGKAVLGVVLAGGRSSRFGSDKAEALLDGVPLLDHVARALAGQVEVVVVAGRQWPGLNSVADEPSPGLGPLGGLLGALRYAAERGRARVLSAPCDCPLLPSDLLATLWPGPSFVAALPPIGLWPVDQADRLARFLVEDARRSVRGWAVAAGARAVTLPLPIPDCNTSDALEALRRRADPRSSR